ncbi:hypothetical protein Pd630_LPD10086 (plasmid) [Rhodococcus opacus PD630]|nr:hypothetical protein Pd630_LPD10086 [Rhodococcus opacus PD630]
MAFKSLMDPIDTSDVYKRQKWYRPIVGLAEGRSGGRRVHEGLGGSSGWRQEGDRPELLDLLRGIFGPGDTLVVWRLDRLGRSLSHLIEDG